MDRPQTCVSRSVVATCFLVRVATGLLFVLCTTQLGATTVGEQVCRLDDTGYLLVDSAQRTLDACRADTPLIPASTMKILTAWLALQHWGSDFHFSTDFYLDQGQVLWVRGQGDPMLVSEELAMMAGALKRRGLPVLSGIGIDASYYAPRIDIPGRSGSDNPYDAPVAALAVNFNTVNLRRKNGQLQSAEAQTPLTPIARKLGQRVGVQAKRINLRNAEDSATYFAEILRHKLIDVGIRVGHTIHRGRVPGSAKHLYRYENSRALPDVIKAMLRYSTNYIANTLFLDLGAEAFGSPATMEKATRYASEKIAESFGWQDFRVVEGAGLSRKNRISARQLIALLQAFHPWKALLPQRLDGVSAKTGTLNGIRSLAGYIEAGEGDRPFAILINSPSPRTLRYDLVKQWKSHCCLPGASD